VREEIRGQVRGELLPKAMTPIARLSLGRGISAMLP
jgi:hypothetical protein